VCVLGVVLSNSFWNNASSVSQKSSEATSELTIFCIESMK